MILKEIVLIATFQMQEPGKSLTYLSGQKILTIIVGYENIGRKQQNTQESEDRHAMDRQN